ncbi:hypothetical protein FNYG_14830 [Fusarium nygamai]|uniref:Uncharacterized protein n=1 Tax=Gibberella nygamai TaxID=42673 RepID=A0A2K0UQ16_GIBNY|nr:hypothetical protein FNYG_14830 [Fusarium nygamai]
MLVGSSAGVTTNSSYYPQRQFCAAVIPPAELSSPLGSVKRARAVVFALPRVLIEAKRGVSTVALDCCKTVPLSWEDLKSARKETEATFRRFDYDPFKGEITVRMSSPIHDRFAGSVEEQSLTTNSVVLETQHIRVVKKVLQGRHIAQSRNSDDELATGVPP